MKKVPIICIVKWLFYAIILMSSLFNSVNAQREHNLEEYASDMYHKTTPLATLRSKEPLVGSPYLTSYWMKGVAEFTDHTTIPTREKIFYFNFDKTRNILIVSDASNNVQFYTGHSVPRFILLDSSNKTYTFEIIKGISQSIYQQPVVKSDLGYSLYKRLVTKLMPSDYTDYGYAHIGVRHDTYLDFYEYYFVYPDKTTYKKFYLDGPGVKKVFRSWPVQMERATRKFNNLLTEEAIIDLVESINEE